MNEQLDTMTKAAVFADLCDYTRLTETYGDEAAAEMATVLGVIARAVARRHKGHGGSVPGDGADRHFDVAADAGHASFCFVSGVRASRLPRARGEVDGGHTRTGARRFTKPLVAGPVGRGPFTRSRSCVRRCRSVPGRPGYLRSDLRSALPPLEG